MLTSAQHVVPPPPLESLFPHHHEQVRITCSLLLYMSTCQTSIIYVQMTFRHLQHITYVLTCHNNLCVATFSGNPSEAV